MGLSTAIALSTSPALSACRLTLLERGPPPPPPKATRSPSDEFSARTCALNARSRALLQRLDVWRRVTRFGTVQRMQIWDACSDAMIRFDANTDAQPLASASPLSSLADALGLSRTGAAEDGSSEADSDALAWIVENSTLLHALNDRLSELSSSCETVYNCREVGVDVARGEVSARVDGDNVEDRRYRRWNCQLIVGADGVGSAVRQAMGVKTVGWSYNQRAVVATLCLDTNGDSLSDARGVNTDNESVLPENRAFQLDTDEDSTVYTDQFAAGQSDGGCEGNCVAWQRFLPSGPLALLPLSSNRSAIVWSTSEQHAQELVRLDDCSFVDAVNSALWRDYSIGSQKADECWRWGSGRLGEVLNATGNRSPSGVRQLPPSISGVAPASRASFPLGLHHALRYIGYSGADRGAAAAVLVGDSAHRVHPLSGHGANLGLADVAELANQLDSSVGNYGRGLRAPQPLIEYERRRMPAAVAMLAVTNTLNALYTSEWQPVVLARSFGLQVCDALSPVRRFLAQNARS